MTYVPNFMKTGTGFQALSRVCPRNLRGCNVGITDGRDLCCTPLRWLHVAWCIPSFMKIGTGVQEILRFCLNNWNDCKIGITDVTD
jgi:hypothetical protein